MTRRFLPGLKAGVSAAIMMTDLLAGQQLGRHVGDFVLDHLRETPAGVR